LPRDSKAIANTHLKIMLLKVNDHFEKSFTDQEKNLMEMILKAKKKRDLHKRLILEADKKAKKEMMVQLLLENKSLLAQYIANNEKQMQVLSNQV
jgi:hypothetical protein